MFAGQICLTRSGWPAACPTDAEMAAPFAVFGTPDREGIAKTDAAILYERRRFVARCDRDETLPRRCADTGAWVSFWGRIDNREQLSKALGIAGLAAGLTDAEIVTRGWARFGRDLPAQLIGDFALAVVDAEKRQVFLARDPMGVKPLYYRCDGGLLAFASTASALKLPGLPLTPDPGWMARFLWGNLSYDPETTAYREIRKVPPGHWMWVDGETAPSIVRWHHWRDDQPDASKRDPAWVDAYRGVLEEAVRCRLPSDYPIGIETSGGIDSSTILAFAAKLLAPVEDRVRAYGFALSEQEPDFILATSQAWGVRHNYIRAGAAPSGEADFARTLAAIGYPEEHGNATFHTPFYRDAAGHGVRTLFSGFGGDEVVTNPGVQALYEHAGRGDLGAMAASLPGNALTRPLRVARHLLRPLYPAPYRPGFLKAWQERWPSCALSESAIEAYGIEAAYMETARFDAPYARVNDFILQHHLAKMQVTARLENCTLAAATWGIDYRWPLWDVRLVQQYLSTPAIEKFGPGGVGRYLHRRAIDGIVPNKVTWKPGKDMGDPVAGGPQNADTRAALIARAKAMRERMPEAVIPLVDAAKLDRQIAQLESGHASVNAAMAIRQTTGSLEWLSRWLGG